jgi:hypothetical protein
MVTLLKEHENSHQPDSSRAQLILLLLGTYSIQIPARSPALPSWHVWIRPAPSHNNVFAPPRTSIKNLLAVIASEHPTPGTTIFGIQFK